MPKMKKYADFAAFAEDQSAPHRAILRALRRFVKRIEPGLVEAVKWGNGCWTVPEGPVAYTHCESDCVQFGFVHGSSLDDPGELLEGNGQYVRFVRLHGVSDIDERALAALLTQAARSAPAKWAAVRRRPARRRQRPPTRGS